MKICWFGIYRPTYPRNDILLSGLRTLGVQVIECRVDGYERFRYFKLIKRFWALSKDFDVVYAAFPSPTAVIVAKLLTRKPIVADAFYSMYDAVVDDRKETPWWNPRALKLKFLDWLSVVLADLVIVDTAAHGRYWASWKLVGPTKIKVVYIGVNLAVTYPLPSLRTDTDFLVMFHGSYIPLQGVDKIIEAARILAIDSSIKFRMVGSGQEYQKARSLARDYQLERIEFVERVLPVEVTRYLAEADVVLGIFGDTAKTQRVIPNKVYEGLAANKPAITTDTPAIREVFTDRELYLIPNTAADIAGAIKKLHRDRALCQRLAAAGHQKIQEEFSAVPIAQSLVTHLQTYLTAR